MKAILIDVKKQEVREVTIKNTPEAINKALKCFTTSTPYKFFNGDKVVIDDQALHNSEIKNGGFMLPEWSFPILGNALIVGTGEEGSENEGEDQDCASIPADFDEVIWLSVAETMDQQYEFSAMF